MRVPSSAPANPILRSHPQEATGDRGQRTPIDSSRICFFVHTDTDTTGSVVMPLDVHSVLTYQAG